MARVKAFRGIYYTEKAGEISKLVAPPYDVLTQDEANGYRRQNEANVVHISVSRKDDPGFYAEAGRLFEGWQKQDLLKRADRPGVYYYEAEFDYTLGGGMRRAKRMGFFALLGLSEYSAGEVLPHERTLSGPKLDQLELLSATRANLSPIFCVYSDPGLKLMKALAAAPKGEPVYDFEFSGFRNRLFGVYDPKLLEQVSAALAKEKVYIADGHHRYETALEYARRLREAKDPRADAAGYVMSFFCPLEDPGLVIFPYHRLLKNLPEERLTGLPDRLKEDFEVQPVADRFSPANLSLTLQRLEATGAAPAVALFDREGRSFVLELKESRAREMAELLEVEILERLVLKEALGITKEEITENRYAAYETSEQKLAERMSAEKFQLVFLVKPIPVARVAERARRGEVMPQKSTYFYPKLPSGMVFRKLAPEPELS